MRKFIYLISPNKIYKNFYKDLKKVLKYKKVAFLQLRFKNINKKKILLISKKVKKITKNFNIKLIINDDLHAAILSKADGCHLGQNDGSILEAKKKMGKKIVGVTCHNSKKLLLKGLSQNADYLALGSFFKSKLKPKASRSNIKTLKWARSKIKKPLVAIGGINDKNYKVLLQAGANYIAISTYIWNNPVLKPYEAIRKFR